MIESEVKEMPAIKITLAAARVNAGMTQEEAAKQMKVDRSTIRRWEKGIKSPDYDESQELARIYNLPFDYIFFGRKTR